MKNLRAPVLAAFRRAPARKTVRERLAGRSVPNALVADADAGGAGTAVAERPTLNVSLDHVTQWAAITAAGAISLHATQEEASASFAEDEGEGAEVLPARWSGTVILEGVRTDDGREIAEGGLTWRDLPLPLMYQEATDWGHNQSVMAGNIETLERKGNKIAGTGSFDLEGDDGKEAARQMGQGFLRWVSADVAVTEWEIVEEGDCDLEDILFGGDGDCTITERVVEGRIMGATLVYFPAFEDATLEPVFADSVRETEVAQVASIDGGTARFARTHPMPLMAADLDTLTASLASVDERVEPVASWFEDPAFGEPGTDARLVEQPDGQFGCPVTVTDEGQVYGHIALWNTCHVGLPDQCQKPPRSATDYAHFRTGEFVTSDGKRIVELESMAMQLAMLDAMPKATQVAMLESTIKGMKSGAVRDLMPHAAEEAVHRDFFVLA